MFHFLQALAFIPGRIIFPLRIYGRKNLPKGKAILTINHTSNLDSVIIALGTYEKKYYLAKKELFKGKIQSAFLKSLGAIKIDRSIADIGAIKNALGVLKKGKKLIIYPEGTRNKSANDENFELGEVKSGAAMLAIKSKSPIVPIWIYNRPKAFRTTKVVIGKPYELDEFYGQRLGDEVLEKASAIVAGKLNEVRLECEKRFKKVKKSKKKDSKVND